ncbi:MAG: glycosyltransferase family 1 protein [Candidatus Electrothrix sp. AUS4]|nr:glycosyltransferase family 1 protein [Candidatus Electrothrix sp. AUS4]
MGINPLNILFKLVSDISLRYADLTIVTNEFLKRIVEDKGGRGFVLVDKLPQFKNLAEKRLQGKFNAVFICTYANDEPYEEVVQAASLLPSSTCIYITGRIPLKFNRENVPDNVILTDYLSETDYVNLLYSADVIMDFTSLDWCLVCGGYEAISLGQPLITSDTVALRDLFEETAVYTMNFPISIAGSINAVQNMHGDYVKKTEAYRDVFLSRWNRSFLELQTLLTRIINSVEE